MSEELRQRIEAEGPKRILSLDGGGIRGLITLGFLERIETVLRAALAAGELDLYRPVPVEKFRLRDYYDLIGGTSTGAILAAGLAIGKSVSELRELYLKLGETIFKSPSWRSRILHGAFARKFDAEPLEQVLEEVLGDRTLGDPSITTGLCIVAKRFDSNSVWPMVNAPANIYYNHPTQPNKDFILRKIVRASTAAPAYFDPELITLGPATYGFIDGGISLHNNPAWQLFLAATVPGFGFKWPVGVDKLSIVSIGTGDWPRSVPLADWASGPMPIAQVASLVDMFMEDASAGNETILQAIGEGTNRRRIDRTIGTLDGALWGPSLLRYERFQVELTGPFFTGNGLAKFEGRIDAYRQMDNIKYMPDLLDIGRIVAEQRITGKVLP